MGQRMPIPRASLGAQSLSGLFKTHPAQGLDVVRAELDLIHAEAAGALKVYVPGHVICAACFALAITTAAILGQVAAIALQFYINGPVMASLATGLAMAIPVTH